MDNFYPTHREVLYHERDGLLQGVLLRRLDRQHHEGCTAAVHHAAQRQLRDQAAGGAARRTPLGAQAPRGGADRGRRGSLRLRAAIVSAAEAGEQAVAQLRTLQAGIVRMGASDSLCKAFLLPYLERFREAHPGIRIVLTHGKSEDISARLSAGTIDCGIVHLPVPEPLLHILAVRPIQDVFVAAPGLAAGTEPHSLADLVRLPFVMLSERSRSRAFFHAYLQTYCLTATPEIEVGSIELLLEFVRRGMGLAFMTRDFAADDLAAGTLVELPVAEPIPGRAIGIITRPGDSLSLAADRFVRGLAESFGG